MDVRPAGPRESCGLHGVGSDAAASSLSARVCSLTASEEMVLSSQSSFCVLRSG